MLNPYTHQYECDVPIPSTAQTIGSQVGDVIGPLANPCDWVVLTILATVPGVAANYATLFQLAIDNSATSLNSGLAWANRRPGYVGFVGSATRVVINQCTQ